MNTPLTKKVLPMLKIQELKELLEKVQAHNHEALTQLCQHFEPFIKKLGEKYSSYANTASDIENMAWIAFIEFVQTCSLERFITLPRLIKTAVTNMLFNQLKSKKYNDPHLVYTDNYQNLSVNTINPEPDIIDGLDLKDSINKLTAKQKKFIQEYYYCDCSYAALAKKMQISINAVKQRHKYIIRKLRGELQEV